MKNVTFYKSQFDASLTEQFHAITGETIGDFLEANQLDDLMTRQPIVVRLNDNEITAAEYHHVIAANDVVTLHAFPQGDPITLALAMGALVAAGTQYFIDKMVDANGSSPDRSPTYDINNRGNAARLGAPKPVFYGTMRTYPDLGAIPYTEYDVNGDQVLFQLFEVRQGDCDIAIANMRFEDTPITSFEGYEVEVIAPGERSTLFPGAVVVSSELDSLEIGATPNDYGDWKDIHDLDSPPDASFYACDIGQTITRISVDVVANNGIFRLNHEGKLRYRRVGVRFEARKVDDTNQPLGNWFALGYCELSSHPANFRNAIRQTHSFSVEQGRYEVRPVRTVTKSDKQEVSDSVHWVGLKGYVSESLPLVTTTRIALKIRASEQLSDRGAGKFNCVSVGKIPVWNPDTGWSAPVITANPAWVYADIARNPVYGGARGDAYIDLPGLFALAQTYANRGIEFHGGFDTQTTVWEALKRVAAVGYAKPVDRAGVYYMVLDAQASVPAYMFTHSNIVKDSFKIDEVQIQDDTPDAYRISFLDEDQGYRESTVICALSGSEQANIKDEKIFGVTNKDQVYKLGMYMAAVRFYRRRRVQFDTGIEGYLPFFWDTISFSHYLIGREGAKQISGDVIAFDGGNILTLSENVDAFTAPYIVLRNLDGSPTAPYPINIVGTNQIQIAQTFDASPLIFEAGVERPHFMLGEGINFFSRVKIDSIKPNGNSTYTISGFVDVPEVYAVANGLPTPPITQLPPMLNVAPVVVNLRAVLAGTIEGPQVLLRWDGRNCDYFIVQLSHNNGADWVTVSDRHYDNYLDHTAPHGDPIIYRVSGVNVLQGQWLTVSISTAESAFIAPPAPTGLQTSHPFVGSVLQLKWNSDYTLHRVGFWLGGEEKYTFLVSGTSCQLDAGTARAWGLGRAFTVKVWSLTDSGKMSEISADLQVNNPVPGPLNNLMVRQSVGTIFIEYDWPTDTDIDGVCVWSSTINNFVPSDANRVINRTKSRMVSVLMPDDVAYIRVAALDVWGDDFTASGQYTLEPDDMLDRLIGKIKESQLHQDLLQKIDLIDAPGTGLVAQVGANTQNLINEINARLSLAQQMRGDYIGTNPTEVTSGLIRATQNNINELSSQMALLSAGSAGQFDYVNIWRFDINNEGWTSSAGTIITTPYGWYTPNGSAGNTYAEKLGLDIDAVKYTQLRFRIRKFGTPSWQGIIYFLRTGFAQWSGVLNVTIPEPEWDANNIAMVTVDMYPTNGYWYGVNVRITALRLIMAYNTSDVNYYSFDWVGVGRPSPGASSAELLAEQTARINADEAFTQQFTAMNAAIAGKASQVGVDNLTGRVTATEQEITTQGNKFTSLDSQLNPTVINANPSFANWTATLPDSWIQWENLSFTKHTGARAYTGGNAIEFNTNTSSYYGIRQDLTAVPNSEYIDIELTFTLVSGSLSGAGLIFDWNNTASANFRVSTPLSSLFTVGEILAKKTVAKFRLKRPVSFTGTFSSYRVFLIANYSGDGLGALATKSIVFDRLAVSIADASAKSIAAHETRITSAENSIQQQATQLNQVQTSLAGKADSSALQSLSSTVQTHGNTLTGQANQIAQVQSGLADKASSSAFNSLSSTVTSQGNQITAQAGQINQLQVSLPGGSNLIGNSEFSINITGWTGFSQGGGSWILDRNYPSADFVPTGHNQVALSRFGSAAGPLQISSVNIPITGGGHYCFSANIAGTNCTVRLVMVFKDSAGNYITEYQNGSWSQAGGTNLASAAWQRQSVFGTAPANARYAEIILRGEDIGFSNERIYLCKPMLSQVPASTTVPPFYEAGNNSGIVAAIKQTADVAVITANEATTTANSAANLADTAIGTANGAVTIAGTAVNTANNAAAAANSAIARWEVKSQVGDLVGGVGFVNDGNEVRFGIHADDFFIYSPGKQSLRFAVVGDKILIPGSLLVGQSIKTEHLEVNAVSASSLFTSSQSSSFGAAHQKTYSVGMGSFLSSGVRAKFLVTATVRVGDAFSNGMHSSTQTVEVYLRLRIDTSPKESTETLVPITRSGSNYFTLASLSLIHHEVLTAGWRAITVDVIFTCRDGAGNNQLQNAATYSSVDVNCLVEENKV